MNLFIDFPFFYPSETLAVYETQVIDLMPCCPAAWLVICPSKATSVVPSQHVIQMHFEGRVKVTFTQLQAI